MMYCSKCKREYEDDIEVCPKCKIPLVKELPEGPVFVELVTIFESSERGIIALAKSILEDAGIKYFPKGEGLQDLFGFGRVGGYNILVGPVEIQVRKDDEEVAKEILGELIR